MTICTTIAQFGQHQRIAPDLSYAYQVRSADLDGDGDQDVVASVFMENRFVQFVNDGAGNFGAAQSVLENAPYAKFIQPADIDGDGDMDLVVAYGLDATYIWLENNGAGDFASAHTIFSSTGASWGFALADIDGDGDLDLVTSTNGALHWHASNGQGTAWAANLVGENTEVADISIGDLNGDGTADLLVAATGTIGTVRWCANDGNGGFGAMQTISTGTGNGIEVVAADLDNDGDLDAAYITNGPHRLGWIENTGSGFAPQVEVGSVLSTVTGLHVADHDGDGWEDLVVTVNGNHSVRIYPNNAGTFGAPVMVTTQANNPRSVVLADIDGDADLDVLYNGWDDARIAWCAQLPGGTFAAEHDLVRAVDYPMSVQAADLDMDGDLDVLTNSWTDGDLFWYPNDGSGEFGGLRTFGNGLPASNDPRIEDLDMDGDPDVAVGYYHGTVGWYTNDGSGEFGALQVVSTADTAIRAFTTGDLNGDGMPDLITGSQLATGKLCWYANTGGAFGAQQVVESGSSYMAVLSGDLDGDGDNDLLATAMPDLLFWFTNDGSGNFGPRMLLADSVNQGRFLAVVDVDGDADNDIIAVRQPIIVFDGGGPIDTLPNVFWMENDGTGNFGPQRAIADFTSSTTMHVVDIDADGDPDLLLSTSVVSLWLNDGTGQFAQAGSISTSVTGWLSVGSGDLDGDGDPDVLLCQSQSDHIGWNENFFGSPYRIEGTVFLDMGGDGIYDTGDTTGTYLTVSTSPMLSTAITDNAGNYTFWLNSGTYEVTSASPGPLWELSTGTPTYTIDLTVADPVATDLVFGFTPIVDTTLITALLTLGTGPCGGQIPLWITVTNQGTRIEQGVVQLELDSDYAFVNALPAPDSIVGNHVYWSFDSLSYFACTSIQVWVEQPQIALAGTTQSTVLTVHRTDVNGTITEMFTDQVEVVLACAYDPNDKQVEPVGYGAFGALPVDQDKLTYTVRFQNTGTAPAYNVMLRDQLHARIDPASLNIMASSHTITHANVEADGELVIRYENIMLPDSAFDLPGSQGFVTFTVHLLNGSSNGTAITNTAHIYFDLNEAVITNTVLNTLVDCALHEVFLTEQEPGLLQASEGEHYQWFMDGLLLQGDTLPTYQATTYGAYSVLVTSVFGCVAESESYPFLSTSIYAPADFVFRVGPNPARYEFVLTASELLTSAHNITLMEVTGRNVLLTTGRGDRQLVIPCGSLAPGAYLLRVSGPEGVSVVKVVLER
jgi:uncharacterized repeat protein (TIGR01451 family)